MGTSEWSFLFFLGLLFVSIQCGPGDIGTSTDNKVVHSVLAPFYPNQIDSFPLLPPLEPLNNYVRQYTNVEVYQDNIYTFRSYKFGPSNASTCVEAYGFNTSLPCEDPEIRARYAAALSPDRFGFEVPRPIIRYNLVVLQNDNGTDPVVSDKDIQIQDAVLRDAYSPVRVGFSYTIQRFNQSILRYRTVLYGPCNRADVLNGRVDVGCMSPLTGWDGGSVMCNNSNCDPTCSDYNKVINRPNECPCVCVPEYFNCVPEMIGNQFCNPECNFLQYNWDGGDCCPSQTTSNDAISKNLTCKDPNNPLRNWLDTFDLYFFLNLDATNRINVVLIPGDEFVDLGDAKTPNDPRYFEREGGVLINTRANGFGVNLPLGRTGLTLVQKIGNVLGLLPTHAGVSSLLLPGTDKSGVCRDVCHEEQPLLSEPGSDTTGDLINDTRPTPRNTRCRDPVPCSPNGEPVFCTDCENTQWLSTPFNNYMGAASDSCPKDWTPQQAGRMYCYVDLLLRRKYLSEGDASPGPVLYAPTLSDFHGAIRVDWSKAVPFETGTTNPPSTYIWYLERQPAFASGTIQVLGDTIYLDKTVAVRTPYRYRVRLVINGQLSAWSPWSDPLALPRVCNCRPWDMSGVKEVDFLRSSGSCKTKPLAGSP